MSTRCKICGGLDISRYHVCPTAWLVWYEGGSRERAGTYYAIEAETAAEKWAEQLDSETVEEMSRRPEIVYVVRADTPDAAPTRVEVRAEYTVDFHAREIERPEGDSDE